MTSISENDSNNMFEDAILLHHNTCLWFFIGIINHIILLFFFLNTFFSKVKFEYLSDEKCFAIVSKMEEKVNFTREKFCYYTCVCMYFLFAIMLLRSYI